MSQIFTGGQQDSNVTYLIAALGDEEAQTRWRAAQELGKLKDWQAVEPLIHSLKDQHWHVRCNAAQALGNIRDTRAAEALIACLKHLDRNTQIAAAQALGNLGDPRAIEPLTMAVRKAQREDELAAIGKALEQLGVPSKALIEKEKAARTKRAKKENERENGIKAMLIGAFIAGGSFIIELFSYASAHVQAVSDAGLNGVGTASYTVAFIPGIFLGVIIFIAGLFTWLLNRF